MKSFKNYMGEDYMQEHSFTIDGVEITISESDLDLCILEVEDEDEESIDEALTTRQRMDRKNLMKKYKLNIARGRKKAAKKRAGLPKLKSRAMKAARNLLMKKLSKGKDKASMSFAEKEKIEKILDSKTKKIKAIAKKLLPKIIKKEKEKQALKKKGGSEE